MQPTFYNNTVKIMSNTTRRFAEYYQNTFKILPKNINTTPNATKVLPRQCQIPPTYYQIHSKDGQTKILRKYYPNTTKILRKFYRHSTKYYQHITKYYQNTSEIVSK